MQIGGKKKINIRNVSSMEKKKKELKYSYGLQGIIKKVQQKNYQ